MVAIRAGQTWPESQLGDLLVNPFLPSPHVPDPSTANALLRWKQMLPMTRAAAELSGHDLQG